MVNKPLSVTAPLLLVFAACTLTQDPSGAARRRAAFEDGGLTMDAGLVDAALTDSPPPPPPPPPPPQDAGKDAALVETYVSDLAYTAVANGYGPVEKDTSNGEDNAADGVTMMIGGVTYNKGLGVHANSEVTLALGGQYKFFFADVGVDDEVADQGSVEFKVLVDGVEVFASGVLTGAGAAVKVSVDVTGKQELKLVVTDAGDGFGFDHADWANARVAK